MKNVIRSALLAVFLTSFGAAASSQFQDVSNQIAMIAQSSEVEEALGHYAVDSIVRLPNGNFSITANACSIEVTVDLQKNQILLVGQSCRIDT